MKDTLERCERCSKICSKICLCYGGCTCMAVTVEGDTTASCATTAPTTTQRRGTMILCRHVRKGIVTNQTGPHDTDRAPASRQVCDRPACIVGIGEWVTKRTGEPAFFRADGPASYKDPVLKTAFFSADRAAACWIPVASIREGLE